jgi:hypothetical protein
MSNPGPPAEDERPLAGPATDMGATSADLPPLVDGSTDPLAIGTPPPARPAPPAYDAPTDLLGTVPDEAAAALSAPTPAYDALAAETGFTPYEPEPSGPGGALAKVKAFATERPAAFLAAALAAGWLVGKLISSDDEDEG